MRSLGARLPCFLGVGAVAVAFVACSSSDGGAGPAPRDGGVDSGGRASLASGGTAGASTTGSGGVAGGGSASGGTSAGGGVSAGGGGVSAGSGGASAGSGGAPSSGGKGLHTQGNKILTADGKPFHGRGANLHDTRSCNACTSSAPNPDGLMKWADELIDGWHANFIRFDLESYADSGGYRVQWKGILDDPQYLTDVTNVVHHMTAKPGVYVMVTVFADPTIPGDGSGPRAEWPTDATQPIYKKLAETFADDPGVLFGLTNEPQSDASLNPELAVAFSKSIQTIRDAEKAKGVPQHVVVAQGTQNWARDLSYWVAHPLTVEGGTNIAYETHPYNPKSDFDQLFVQPAKTIPVIIGEFGPTQYSSMDDVQTLMELAETNEIPYISWNFHQRCPPNLLEDKGGASYDGCGFSGAGTTYTWPPTDWGTAFKAQLAKPY